MGLVKNLVEYVNISIYSPLSGKSYIEMPNKLKNSIKCLINIKNNDNKCFIWCHIRHVNPLKIHTERITSRQKMVKDLGYVDIKCPVSKKDYGKIEHKNSIFINVFCYENELVYPVHVSNKKLDFAWIYC